MKKIGQFEDFDVWKKASAIAADIIVLTNEIPLKNDFSIKDQLRRAAFSIASNIAEGYEYDNNKDFIRFLRYAKGSAGELRSQLYVLHTTQMVSTEYYQNARTELIALSRQLAGLIRYLKQHTNKQ